MAKKISSWTLEQKIEMIKDYENSGLSKSGFAKLKNIPRTTLTTILASKEKIENSLHVQDGSKRKKLRMSNFEDIEEALIKWFSHARSQNAPISGLVLREKALEIANEFGLKDFSASNGWIERFKERHGLKFKKICGEAASVDQTIVTDWKNSLLKDVLQRYDPKDVYNLDETGLFFRLLPEKTLCFKNESCSGGKKSKDRLTVLLGTNMLGTDKLKPVVIGKSAKPRCFKNVKFLPVFYKANGKSWMSSEIWEDILKLFDKKFFSQKRKVAFVVDNCTAHTKVRGLKSIELIYMPPNVTSVLQPLDQGVILSFKRNYRKLMVKDWIKSIDENCTFRPSILDAIQYIHRSWKSVSSDIIKNCFKHAGFFEDHLTASEAPEDSDSDDENNVPLSVLFSELKKRNKTISENIDSYIEIDANVTTSSGTTIPDIVDEVRENRTESPVVMSSEESDEGSETEEKPPTKSEASQSISVIRKYLLSVKETTEKDYDCLYQIEKRILSFNSRNKQTSIHKYFSSQ